MDVGKVERVRKCAFFVLKQKCSTYFTVFEEIRRVAKLKKLVQASQHVLIEPLLRFLYANIFKHNTGNKNNMLLLQLE